MNKGSTVTVTPLHCYNATALFQRSGSTMSWRNMLLGYAWYGYTDSVTVSVGHVIVVSQHGSLSQVFPLYVEGWTINRRLVTTGGAGAGTTRGVVQTTFSKQFFLNNSFLCKSQKCLETCVNCVWNCVTLLFTPLEGPFSKNIFSKNILLPHMKCKTCSEGDIWKIVRRRITDLKNQGPSKSQYCKKKLSRCIAFYGK